MKKLSRCPRCGSSKYWKIRRGGRKCTRCRYEYRIKVADVKPLKIQWKKIIEWFVLEQSIERIVEQTGISKYKVMKALMHIRKLMAADVPEAFSGVIEVDETYLGGQWKNKRKTKRSTVAKRGRGTSKRPVFGILCRGGKVWAKIVREVEAKTLMPLIKKRV
jgi:transposase